MQNRGLLLTENNRGNNMRLPSSSTTNTNRSASRKARRPHERMGLPLPPPPANFRTDDELEAGEMKAAQPTAVPGAPLPGLKNTQCSKWRVEFDTSEMKQQGAKNFDDAIGKIKEAAGQQLMNNQSDPALLIDAINELKKIVCNKNKVEFAEKVGQETLTLVTCLVDVNITPEDKQKAIEKFKENTQPMSRNNQRLLKALGAVIGAAIGAVIGMMIGLIIAGGYGAIAGAAAGAAVGGVIGYKLTTRSIADLGNTGVSLAATRAISFFTKAPSRQQSAQRNQTESAIPLPSQVRNL